MTKARNIARAGGKLAIVIDTENESIDNILMSDDGTGAGIRIPSILIGHGDGDLLTNFIERANPSEIEEMELNVHFVNPYPRDKVKFEMWYSSVDDRSLAFLRDMGEFIKPIQNDLEFSPRTVSWSCPDCDTDFKMENCFGDGQYCAIEKDFSPIPGKDIVLEDLREQCVWKELNDPQLEIAKDVVKPKFFDYIRTVHEMCPNGRVTRQCHSAAIFKEALPQSAIDACVKNSFNSKGVESFVKDGNSILSKN